MKRIIVQLFCSFLIFPCFGQVITEENLEGCWVSVDSADTGGENMVFCFESGGRYSMRELEGNEERVVGKGTYAILDDGKTIVRNLLEKGREVDPGMEVMHLDSNRLVVKSDDVIIEFKRFSSSIMQGNSFLIRKSIYLDTVSVWSKGRKTMKVQLRGFPMYNGLSQTKSVVSFVALPVKSHLKSVSFYFNCGMVNRLKKRLKINYKDVELGIVIYRANADSTLGKVISENEILFTVPASHRGPFKVDLSSLAVQEDLVFIGFSVISELTPGENNIYVRYNEKRSARTFVKYSFPPGFKEWHSPRGPNPYELKLNLEAVK